jgi:hypothetical protein
MIDIDIDSYEFGGFAGVKSGEPSASRFTLQMCSVNDSCSAFLDA